MASVITRKGKRGKLREIQFNFRGRQVVRVGRCTLKQASTVRMHIEALIAQAMTGHAVEKDTQAWMRKLPDDIHERIARTGLCESRGSFGLEAWVDRCIKAKEQTDKRSTTTRKKQARRFLLAHFDAGKDLRTFTPGDAEDFEAYLYGQELAVATVRKRLADTRQWFGAAVKHKLIEANPFEGVTVSVPETKNLAYIHSATAKAVMDALPNARLRLVFALARWGGLRTPSEPVTMLWRDVNWDKSTFTFIDQKRTTKKTGVKTRTVPIFPELVGPFQDWFDQAPEGSVEVFPGMSTNSSALTGPVERAIKLAGVDRWPRLMQNLRASRETDLIAEFMEAGRDIKTVCAWIGNSPEVALKHYAMTRDMKADIEAVTGGAVKIAAPDAPKRGRTGIEKPANGSGSRQRGKSVAPEGLDEDSEGVEDT